MPLADHQLVPRECCGCCEYHTVLSRFSKTYRIDCSKSVTIGQLYRYFKLNDPYDPYPTCVQECIKLSIAVDKQGNSRGIAILQVPNCFSKYIEGYHERKFKGEIVQVRENKLFKQLKLYKWEREYGFNGGGITNRNLKVPVFCKKKRQPLTGDDNNRKHFDVCADLLRFVCNLDFILARAYMQGIQQIHVPCYNINDCLKAAMMANSYRGKIDIYFSAGIAPRACLRWRNGLMDELEKLYQMENCLCAGVIGLDYSDSRVVRIEKQLDVFEKQVKLAVKYRKPILIEVHNAAHDALQILRKYQHELPPIALHRYSGSTKNISGFVDIGCYFVATAQRVSTRMYILEDYLEDLIESRQITASRILLGSNAPGHQNSKPVNANRGSVKNSVEFTLSRTVTTVFHVAKYLVTTALEVENGEQLDQVFHDNAQQFFQLGPYTLPKSKPWGNRYFSTFRKTRLKAVLNSVCELYSTVLHRFEWSLHIFVFCIIVWMIIDCFFL